MKVLFPQNELHAKEVQEEFALEFNAAKIVEFETFLFNEDFFVRKEILRSNLPVIEKPEPLLLRSWMMKIDRYEQFYNELLKLNYVLINNPYQYKICHHSYLINDLFGNHAAKIITIPNLTKEHFEKLITPSILEIRLAEMKIGFSSDYFLLKDSVKSEKDIPELFKIPVDISPADFHQTLERFINERGSLYNDGLVFKEFLSLKKYSGNTTNEWRIFVLNGKAILSTQNDNKAFSLEKPPPLVDWLHNIIQTIPSNFFTIDLAELDNGEWIIIEAGDGQVSGLPPRNLEIAFFDHLHNHLTNHKHLDHSYE